MRKLLPASALFVLCVSLPAAAQLLPLSFQVPAPAVVPATPTTVQGRHQVGGPGRRPPARPASPATPRAAPSGGAKESPRLAKLKQLQFDRRPSAVLKAWAPAPKKDPKDDAAPKKDPKDEALDKELADFQKNVSTGQWDKVKDYLASLPDEESLAAYKQLLTSLQRSRTPRRR